MTDETPKWAIRKRISELRLIALAEIATGDTGLDPFEYYTEVQNLTLRPLSKEWLEAAIMFACIAKFRHARAIGYMQKLRTRHEKSGTLEQFGVFEKRIADYLAPLALTNHGFHAHRFGETDHAPIWAKVETHLKALGDAGYDVFLNSGTLLGVVRDKRLIDHDDDIDLAVVLKSTDALSAAEEWRGMEHKLDALGLLERTVDDMPGLYKLRPAGKIEIDLFPAWIEDGRAYVYPHTAGELSEEQLLPLAPCPLTGQSLPAAPADMLAVNYGPGWETPDPLYKFPWADANDRFARFLEGLK
ncbi:LicD family protein [Sulfitobacter sp. S190]|uniref:LicD family protein n=1 Tax=Sulfitobacter sp. S190 TaxID=2867022 RepID=UPI0021A7B5B4|nr:LicD family protein [Sulfitobacter sp. S190]UWR24022.1 LicD family protein [Sulfitobacter sp. S190]